VNGTTQRKSENDMLGESQFFESKQQTHSSINIANVVIAEDHAILRAGLCAMLATEPDFQVIGEASSGRDAIRMVGKLNPDLLLLDLSMPNSNGTEAINIIKRRYPDTKIVVLTVHKAEEYIRAALEAGADGYVLKDDDQSELFTALRNILEGKPYLSPSICDKIVSGYLGGPSEKSTSHTWSSLTQREREVMKLIAEGYRNKGVAEYLSISPKTVEKHRSNLMKKLNLHSASAITAFAIENGLI